MRVLVTGGAGFIGHHLVGALLAEGHDVVSLDRLDLSGNLNRLAEVATTNTRGRLRHFFHDLKAPLEGQKKEQIGKVDWVLHLAASSHVDRSIEDPASFVLDNVLGTTHALLYARDTGARFLYFSTDEVFGPAPGTTAYGEWDRYNSGNPYAASKAGGEEMALAFANTYKMHVVVTHTMNVIGIRQSPEKFLPACIRNIRKDQEVTIHADPECKTSGSRFYICAQDVARALVFLTERGVSGEKYNIVGEREMSNLELAETVAMCLGKTLRYRLVNFHESRPGHDLRYALDGKKMAQMGFVLRVPIAVRIRDIVRWTCDNERWL